MFLEERNGGQKGIINIKNPSIFTITFHSAASAEVELDLFNGSLRICFILSRCHVMLDVIYTFLRHNLKFSNVVDLNINPPTLTIVLQA